MTTLTVVKKEVEFAMAADGLTTFGDTRLARGDNGKHAKISSIASSTIGIRGSSAHHQAPQGALSKLEEICFGSRMKVHEIKLEGKQHE